MSKDDSRALRGEFISDHISSPENPVMLSRDKISSFTHFIHPSNVSLRKLVSSGLSITPPSNKKPTKTLT